MVVTFVLLLVISTAYTQQIGTLQQEVHPPLTTYSCTATGTCNPDTSTSVVLDANWRWTHQVGSSTNCYTGDEWDASLCPDPITCAKNCAIDGANYEGSYGITTNGDEMAIKLVTTTQYGTNIGARTYVMADDTHYKLWNLKNREFVFDVDVSKLPCGLNGALYFVQMDADGGQSKYSGDKAGAAYGTGYCDAQCPSDIKFINGQANLLNWKPDPNDPNSGDGFYGTCCTEMDIWEANSISSAVTPHMCKTNGQYRCNGTECGDGGERFDGVCDKNGCDLNPFRGGASSFYGPGFTVDTTQPFSVVTSFVTSDGTDAGDLVEIKRYFVQNGKVIPHPTASNIGKSTNFSSVTDAFCKAKAAAYTDNDNFETFGGLKRMGDVLAGGVVLVLSEWVDYAVHMLWLDSDYPTDAPPSQPGVPRGSCATSSGDPADVIKNNPDSTVQFSKISLGPVGFMEARLKR